MSDKIILYGDCYSAPAGITNFDVVQTSGNDFDFIVQDIEGHRINSVKVIKKSNDDGSSNDKKE